MENRIMNFAERVCHKKSKHLDQDLFCYLALEINQLKASRPNSPSKQVCNMTVDNE